MITTIPTLDESIKRMKQEIIESDHRREQPDKRESGDAVQGKGRVPSKEKWARPFLI